MTVKWLIRASKKFGFLHFKTLRVMAGLDPAIHVSDPKPKTWMSGMKPGMTEWVSWSLL
jgi:hypothetical protein